MKKLLTALFGAALILGACGGDEPTPAPAEPAPSETPADETAAGTFDATRAEAAYQSCIGCHGGDLQGQGNNPAITGLTAEEVLAAIQAGPGIMPANMVTGEEAENLAAWVAAQ
ncbi:cytochrome c [Anaerobacillus sp. CMMVII]|uniref:c-type cytochrome n=1 Tax=Anaerobacillus sp. CMMVII TaxID=2755588 RepID=UPI0021B74A00|nr:cytochrome c [Anaerobacillus sp. CMMVII]MCT8140173.1 cytochrome c [Anaerobacillus sp. CMMVII]